MSHREHTPGRREARGKHTAGSKYEPGDSWAVCQRCGHDVYASDLLVDGYNDGLAVCPKCFDPKHPSDYPPLLTDTMSPQGLTTGSPGVGVQSGGTDIEGNAITFVAGDITGDTLAVETGWDGVGVEGSTDNPLSTFADPGEPSL